MGTRRRYGGGEGGEGDKDEWGKGGDKEEGREDKGILRSRKKEENMVKKKMIERMRREGGLKRLGWGRG